jgi:hypothetical protein
MSITLAKAYEIINLNIVGAASKMHPDVKASLQLALSALAFTAGARAAGTVRPGFILEGEALEPSANNNHQSANHSPNPV